MGKLLIPLALVVWIGAGLWFARDDLDFIWSMARFARYPQFDQRMYLYGSDYLAYDDLLNHTSKTDRILALVPGSYYYIKLTHFLYPRYVWTIGDPTEVKTQLATGNYDVVWVYFPPGDNYWGMIRVADYAIKYQWDANSVYQGLVAGLGEQVVGSESAFLNALDNNYGNMVYVIGEQ